MPIKSSDLQYWSVTQDGILKQRLSTNVLNNFMPSLTGVQNRDLSNVNYVIAILNNHASLALTSAKIYFRILDASGATLSMALDPLGPAVKTGTVWSPTNPPTTYTTPTTIGTGLSVATLNPGFVQCVWIKRVATASAARRPEKNTLTIVGTTPA